jgi:hypothetical protein
MPRTTRELLDIASNHADGEEAVAATLNTPQGKGKQVVDHGDGTSSRFKKKKKKSAVVMTTLSRRWSARRHAPRAIRPSLHHPGTTSRGS